MQQIAFITETTKFVVEEEEVLNYQNKNGLHRVQRASTFVSNKKIPPNSERQIV